MTLDQVVSWWGHLVRCQTVTCSSAAIHLAKCDQLTDWQRVFQIFPILSLTRLGSTIATWSVFFIREIKYSAYILRGIYFCQSLTLKDMIDHSRWKQPAKTWKSVENYNSWSMPLLCIRSGIICMPYSGDNTILCDWFTKLFSESSETSNITLRGGVHRFGNIRYL